MLERTLTLFNKDLESLRVLGSLHIVIWCFERITLADIRVVNVYRGAEIYGTGMETERSLVEKSLVGKLN